MYECMYVCMYVCMYLCMYVCMYVYMYVVLSSHTQWYPNVMACVALLVDKGLITINWESTRVMTEDDDRWCLSVVPVGIYCPITYLRHSGTRHAGAGYLPGDERTRSSCGHAGDTHQPDTAYFKEKGQHSHPTDMLDPQHHLHAGIALTNINK